MKPVLYITDREVIRRMAAEAKRRGDPTPTKTATKVLLEYFALRDHGVIPVAGGERRRQEPAAAQS